MVAAPMYFMTWPQKSHLIISKMPLVTQISYIQCVRELQKDMNTGRQGLLEPILEESYHILYGPSELSTLFGRKIS